MSAVLEELSQDSIAQGDAPEANSRGSKYREKLVYAGSMHWVHWTVVGLSILLTFGAWWISKQQVEARLEERFQRESEQVVDLVRERLELYENALWGAASLIDSNGGEISYTQWLAYSRSLHLEKVYPGVNGIGVIFNILPDQMPSFLQQQRLLRPDFKIHPNHSETESWPITYIEPAETNHKAVGLDMAFESNRYNGIKKSRDTGKARLTGPITLVQDARKTPGFLFYAPFYKKGLKPATLAQRRENIVGVTYAPFIMHKLMQGTLATENRQVSFNIEDRGELLYQDSSNEFADVIDPNPQFTRSLEREFYGRNWVFDLSSNLLFRASSTNNQPLFILAGGIVIDSMLLALFIFLTKANRKALSYADRMTEELRLRTDHLVKSNQDLEEFAYVASHDLKSPLNAIKKLVGWIEEDIENKVPENSIENLALLRGRSERMSRLLDDLLEYSRVGRLSSVQEEVQLKKLVEEIFGLLDRTENFSLSVEAFEMSIPRIPFEIVIRNLISNAIKHHDKDSGKIEVSAKIVDEFYQVRVQDDGPGIPQNMHSKAMEMFQTLQPRDQVEGSGMGLAISSKILHNFRGSIAIDSDGNRGTGILVSWPISHPVDSFLV